MKKLLPVLLCSLPLAVRAEAPPPVQAVDEPPASIAPSAGLGEELEPEVRIIKRDDAEIEEYRINGQLYMVKVTPVVGPPYYLFDSTGDGTLDTRRSEIDPGLVVPRWMIFRW